MKYSFVTHPDGLDNSLHTYNRYGVQLGEKVPLWGGFTGQGKFTLKLWTERPKIGQAVVGWAHRGRRKASSVGEDHLARQ